MTMVLRVHELAHARTHSLYAPKMYNNNNEDDGDGEGEVGRSCLD